MGLLRAVLIVSAIYAIWQVLEKRFLGNIPEPIRAKWVPMLPLALVFIVELLL